MSSAAQPRPVRLCARPALKRILADLRGRRVTLMGLGLFGGGVGAARFLCERGAELTVTDLRPASRLSTSLEQIDHLPVRLRLGEHRTEDFEQADLVVANPAVVRTSPFLRAAEAAGVPVTSPLNIFLALCPAPVAAVSGSNGKSTTTALLAAILAQTDRRVWLGGNIGISLLPSLGRIGPDDVVALEISSFQLEDAAALRWSPHVAVLTNLTPNHLDRHGTPEAYAAAKRNMLLHQGAGDVAVLNAQDAVLRRWADEGVAGRLILFDSDPEHLHGVDAFVLMGGRLVWTERGRHEVICLREDVPLLGIHNVENAMAAAAAARCLGAGREHIRQALAGFVGLAHRMELVGVFRGMRFYNDSYSTTPESSIAALESLPGSVTLIAGGYDKKLDLNGLARAAARIGDVVVTIGQTGPRFAQSVRQEGLCLGRHLVVREAQSLQDAIAQALRLSMPGSAVLFSPACPSYDMFENYRHRGEVFKDLVKRAFRRPA